MKKTIILGLLVLFAFIACAGEKEAAGIYVKGNKIYAPDGEEIILRGVNKMFVWTDREGNSIPEIAKTGANSVRIVWTMKDGNYEGLDKLIEKCAANKMIPIVELHDATCKWDEELFKQLTAWWTAPEMIAIAKKHQKYLMINYGNEIGDWKTTVAGYNKKYTAAVKAMRKAGIHVPIIIDAGKCGQDMNNYYAGAEEILNADPDKNIIFSIHMWWTDNDENRVKDALESVSYTNAPLVVGEFAAYGIGCVKTIAYKAIMEHCAKNNIGWLAWSWGPGNSDCAEMDMTKDSKFTGLYGWGKEAAVDGEYSIKKTSKIPKFMAE